MLWIYWYLRTIWWNPAHRSTNDKHNDSIIHKYVLMIKGYLTISFVSANSQWAHLRRTQAEDVLDMHQGEEWGALQTTKHWRLDGMYRRGEGNLSRIILHFFFIIWQAFSLILYNTLFVLFAVLLRDRMGIPPQWQKPTHRGDPEMRDLRVLWPVVQHQPHLLCMGHQATRPPNLRQTPMQKTPTYLHSKTVLHS
jgi:hypothetical protein